MAETYQPTPETIGLKSLADLNQKLHDNSGLLEKYTLDSGENLGDLWQKLIKTTSKEEVDYGKQAQIRDKIKKLREEVEKHNAQLNPLSNDSELTDELLGISKDDLKNEHDELMTELELWLALYDIYNVLSTNTKNKEELLKKYFKKDKKPDQIYIDAVEKLGLRNGTPELSTISSISDEKLLEVFGGSKLDSSNTLQNLVDFTKNTKSDLDLKELNQKGLENRAKAIKVNIKDIKNLVIFIDNQAFINNQDAQNFEAQRVQHQAEEVKAGMDESDYQNLLKSFVTNYDEARQNAYVYSVEAEAWKRQLIKLEELTKELPTIEDKVSKEKLSAEEQKRRDEMLRVEEIVENNVDAENMDMFLIQEKPLAFQNAQEVFNFSKRIAGILPTIDDENGSLQASIEAAAREMEDADLLGKYGKKDDYLLNAREVLHEAKKKIESWVTQKLVRIKASQNIIAQNYGGDEVFDGLVSLLRNKLQTLSTKDNFDSSLLADITAIDAHIESFMKDRNVDNGHVFNQIFDAKLDAPENIDGASLDSFFKLVTIDGKNIEAYAQEQLDSASDGSAVKDLLRNFYDLQALKIYIEESTLKDLKEKIETIIQGIEQDLENEADPNIAIGLTGEQISKARNFVDGVLKPLREASIAMMAKEKDLKLKEVDRARGAQETLSQKGYDYLFISAIERTAKIALLKTELTALRLEHDKRVGLESKEEETKTLESELKQKEEMLRNLEAIEAIADQHKDIIALQAVDVKNSLFLATMFDAKDSIVSSIATLRSTLKAGGVDDKTIDSLPIFQDAITLGFEIVKKAEAGYLAGDTKRLTANEPTVYTLSTIEAQIKTIRSSIGEIATRNLVAIYAKKTIAQTLDDTFTETDIKAGGTSALDRAAQKGCKLRLAGIDIDGTAFNRGTGPTTLKEAAQLIEKNYSRYVLLSDIIPVLIQIGCTNSNFDDGYGRYFKPDEADKVFAKRVFQTYSERLFTSHQMSGGQDLDKIDINTRYMEVAEGQRKDTAIINNMVALVRAYMCISHNGEFMYDGDGDEQGMFTKETFSKLFGDNDSRPYIAKYAKNRIYELSEEDKQQLRDSNMGDKIGSIEFALAVFKQVEEELRNSYQSKAELENAEQVRIENKKLANLRDRAKRVVTETNRKLAEQEDGEDALEASVRNEIADALELLNEASEKPDISQEDLQAEIDSVLQLIKTKVSETTSKEVNDFSDHKAQLQRELANIYMDIITRSKAIEAEYGLSYSSIFAESENIFNHARLKKQKEGWKKVNKLYAERQTEIDDLKKQIAELELPTPQNRLNDFEDLVGNKLQEIREQVFSFYDEDGDREEIEAYMYVAQRIIAPLTNVGLYAHEMSMRAKGCPYNFQQAHLVNEKGAGTRGALIYRFSKPTEDINAYESIAIVSEAMHKNADIAALRRDSGGFIKQLKDEIGDDEYWIVRDDGVWMQVEVETIEEDGVFKTVPRKGKELVDGKKVEVFYTTGKNGKEVATNDAGEGFVQVKKVQKHSGSYAEPQPIGQDEKGRDKYEQLKGVDRFANARERGIQQLCIESPYWASFLQGVDENGNTVLPSDKSALYHKFSFSWTPTDAYQDNPELDLLFYQSDLLEKKTIFSMRKIKTGLEKVRDWSSAEIKSVDPLVVRGEIKDIIGTQVSLVVAFAHAARGVSDKVNNPDYKEAIEAAQEAWNRRWSFYLEKTTAYLAAKIVRYYSAIKIDRIDLVGNDVASGNRELNSIREQYNNQQLELFENIRDALGDVVSSVSYYKGDTQTSIVAELNRVNEICSKVEVDLSSSLLRDQQALLERSLLKPLDGSMGRTYTSEMNFSSSLGDIRANKAK